MSRARNARRKAKRREAQAATELSQRQSLEDSRRPVILAPVLAIAAILVAAAVLGFGASNGPSRKQIDQEVTALLAGTPQRGAILGFPDAPVTLQMFADLECPTVKRFVESYLPSIISTWVRSGDLKIEHRSLETDTVNEKTFFKQEEAALAAGSQDKMWNFVLTFLGQQGQPNTEYATDVFFARIASQVPELNEERWNRNREDPLLFKQVAISVHSAHAQGLRYTPSFVIVGRTDPSVQDEIESSLEKIIRNLRGRTPFIGPPRVRVQGWSVVSIAPGRRLA